MSLIYIYISSSQCDYLICNRQIRGQSWTKLTCSTEPAGQEVRATLGQTFFCLEEVEDCARVETQDPGWPH